MQAKSTNFVLCSPGKFSLGKYCSELRASMLAEPKANIIYVSIIDQSDISHSTNKVTLIKLVKRF